MNRKPYPSDGSDEEWARGAPSLTLMPPAAAPRTSEVRAGFNAVRWLAVRWVVRTGAHGRMRPHDLPAWPAVYPQMRRWLAAGVFDASVQDLRASCAWPWAGARAPAHGGNPGRADAARDAGQGGPRGR